jgi:DNA-binding Xre family transcriptional regulator
VLLDWWMAEVRHQSGDDWTDPDALLLISERRDEHTGFCRRIGDQALRDGLAFAVGRWLPCWSDRLSPHTRRHYCASSLYARGMDLKAIQELLGHSWLSTTGKMSALWIGDPVTIRLDDLDVICAVLECTPPDLLICEPGKVAARRPARAQNGPATPVTPVLGRHRSVPPA